ncbi:aminotransferase class I/II-fold pyridoxal phosphate-dependent enzyme [Streptomyces triculaminicus]|uniref:Aminotransferase n=2 Tax=Streptomyces TaxID=1883 RepID=A0A939FMI8_9ACTN|nr:MULTISPECIES: aminotransferase class I/II-fold pyridoxal phosphate-dependent enzyme [Streptomyces]MBO0654323.1 aminotransferase class I/II-fold pyridoxal phosphate-dependent enzyme [Streptomyces triculaminicus]QSY48960.1 aminotransferase class I/II-fold pyridoxal phosphate-dependent enzyme [Streptomyces griseocarneus]
MTGRAERLEQTENHLFSLVDRARALAGQDGVAPIPLGVGDCDLPAPPHIVRAMRQAVRDPGTHRYPPSAGTPALREAAARHLGRRFGLRVDPATGVVVTLGSKEAMAHLTMAYAEAGDVVLVPDPAYPVYATWARWCGAEVVRVPLREENGFLPDLSAIPADAARRAKLFWVCYPNNPTAALATEEFYARLADFALRHDIVVASDAAYSDIYYDCAPPPSFLQAPGAMECGIEFHSLSKAYNMPGWRVGFAVGNAAVVDALRTVKAHTDSGTFGAVQHAAVTALNDTTGYPAHLRSVYRERMRLLCDGLEQAGLRVLRPRATFSCLVRCPAGHDSEAFSKRLLQDARVLSIPGSGFGPGGEGYVRLTVCAGTDLIREAVRRIGACHWG